MFFFVLMVADDVFPLCMDVVEVMVVSKVMLIVTFVTTKYSTPSQVVPLVMPFPKLSLEPL